MIWLSYAYKVLAPLVIITVLGPNLCNSKSNFCSEAFIFNNSCASSLFNTKMEAASNIDLRYFLPFFAKYKEGLNRIFILFFLANSAIFLAVLNDLPTIVARYIQLELILECEKSFIPKSSDAPL